MEIKLGVAKLVDDYLVSKQKEEAPRDYLGASILGTECDRALWYKVKEPRQAVEGRRQMIFDIGHSLEDYIITLLKGAGIQFYDNPDGGQWGFVDSPIAGHCDGVVYGLPESDQPHLLEIKTLGFDWWTKLQKSGLEAYSNTYWVQVHVYMHYLQLENCLFVAMNKDNCELYFERVKYDKRVADMAILRGKDIAIFTQEPERKYGKSNFYKCKMCDFNKKCWGL